MHSRSLTGTLVCRRTGADRLGAGPARAMLPISLPLSPPNPQNMNRLNNRWVLPINGRKVFGA